MDSKEYKISEIVDDIGVSKATVYNKIASLKGLLRNHIKLRKGVKYIDYKRIEIIKNSIGLSKKEFNGLNEDCEKDPESYENANDSNSQETLETSMKYIESLENKIEYLKRDNTFLKDILDKEIDLKNKQLEAKDQLLQNFQVLLGQEQERNRMLVETSKMNQKRSFWRLFMRQ